MEEIKHIITEDWEEDLLRNIVGDETIAELKYRPDKYGRLNDDSFNPQTEYLEITIKRIPK